MINYEPQSPGITEMTKTFITVWARCMPVVKPPQTTLWIRSLPTNGEENFMNKTTGPVEWACFESSANQRHKPNFHLCWEIIQSKLSANATQSQSFWKGTIFTAAFMLAAWLFFASKCFHWYRQQKNNIFVMNQSESAWGKYVIQYFEYQQNNISMRWKLQRLNTNSFIGVSCDVDSPQFKYILFHLFGIFRVDCVQNSVYQ